MNYLHLYEFGKEFPVFEAFFVQILAFNMGLLKGKIPTIHSHQLKEKRTKILNLEHEYIYPAA